MLGFDLVSLIKHASYAGLFFIVFAESGLFFGFFLPGDSLLFTAGFLASQGILNIYWLLPLVTSAAILGDSVGYWMGSRFSRWLMLLEDRWYFKKEYIHEAEKFYQKHGGKTIILARFIPIVRTFAPIVAGMAHMHYEKFVFFNIIGGFLWGLGVTLAGLFLGQIIPNADKYLLPIVVLIIIVSVLPGLVHLKKGKKQ